MNIKLNILNKEEESDFLSSHILGCPDVPSVWNDDAVFFNDEVFIGQINLKDIKSDLLPKEGILYFFIQTMSHPYRGIVRYSNDLETCERIDFNSEIETPYNLNVEASIEFKNDDSLISLLPTEVKFNEYHLKKDEVILLSLNFMDYKEIDLFKDIDENVSFIIKKKDLENEAFDKAYLSLLLDN